MRKQELIKMLKTLCAREFRNNSEVFIENLRAEGMDDVDIRGNLGVKEGLKLISKALGIGNFFNEITIDEDNNPEGEDGILKENMNGDKLLSLLMPDYLRTLRRNN